MDRNRFIMIVLLVRRCDCNLFVLEIFDQIQHLCFVKLNVVTLAKREREREISASFHKETFIINKLIYLLVKSILQVYPNDQLSVYVYIYRWFDSIFFVSLLQWLFVVC